MTEPRSGVCLQVSVERVKDADTIEVSFTRKFSVRLMGGDDDKAYLNAEDKNTVEGEAAMERVIELLKNDGVSPKQKRYKDVKLFVPNTSETELMDFNSFSRILGEIWVDGESLGDIILEEGHAKLKKF